MPPPRQVPERQVQLFSTRWRCARGRRQSTRALLFALSFRTLHQTQSLRAPRPSRTAVSALSCPCGGAHSLSPVPLCTCAPRPAAPTPQGVAEDARRKGRGGQPGAERRPYEGVEGRVNALVRCEPGAALACRSVSSGEEQLPSSHCLAFSGAAKQSRSAPSVGRSAGGAAEGQAAPSGNGTCAEHARRTRASRESTARGL